MKKLIKKTISRFLVVVFAATQVSSVYAEVVTGEKQHIPVKAVDVSVDAAIQPSVPTSLEAMQEANEQPLMEYAHEAKLGDLTMDGKVDAHDAVALKIAIDNSDPSADLNQDGVVDAHDVTQMLIAFNKAQADAKEAQETEVTHELAFGAETFKIEVRTDENGDTRGFARFYDADHLVDPIREFELTLNPDTGEYFTFEEFRKHDVLTNRIFQGYTVATTVEGNRLSVETNVGPFGEGIRGFYSVSGGEGISGRSELNERYGINSEGVIESTELDPAMIKTFDENGDFQASVELFIMKKVKLTGQSFPDPLTEPVSAEVRIMTFSGDPSRQTTPERYVLNETIQIKPVEDEDTRRLNYFEKEIIGEDFIQSVTVTTIDDKKVTFEYAPDGDPSVDAKIITSEMLPDGSTRRTVDLILTTADGRYDRLDRVEDEVIAVQEAVEVDTFTRQKGSVSTRRTNNTDGILENLQRQHPDLIDSVSSEDNSPYRLLPNSEFYNVTQEVTKDDRFDRSDIVYYERD